MSKPKSPPTSAPRERIVVHAVELFAVHGFDAVTMRQLGEAVGLDNSSLYRHFRSKAELIEAVLNHVAAELAAACAPFLSGVTSPTVDWLEDIAAALGRHLFDHPASARLVMHWVMATGAQGAGFGISMPATDTSRPGGQLLTALRDNLAEAASRGRLRRHTVPEALVLLLGMVVLRPATQGYLLKTMEPRRRREAARDAWEKELRAAVRGAFAP